MKGKARDFQLSSLFRQTIPPYRLNIPTYPVQKSPDILENLGTFFQKPRDVFEKASLGFLKDTATKSPKGAPQGREKTLFDGYFVFFLRLCRFLLYLCISYN